MVVMSSTALAGRRSDGLLRPAVLIRHSPAMLRRGALLVRSVPLTSGLLGVLLLTTIGLRSVRHDQQVLQWASTNLDNLATRPIRSLVASALVLPSEVWLPSALALGAGLGLIERRTGSRVALAVFASAHVLVTLLTEGGVWGAIQLGGLPESATGQIDAGVSYGMYGALGAAVVLLPRQLRIPALTAVTAMIAVPLASDVDMTTVGHLLSLGVGVAWWPVLRRRVAASRSAAAPTG